MGGMRDWEGNLQRLTSHGILLRYPIMAVLMQNDILIRSRLVMDGNAAPPDGNVG
jgi:hypothetical protein